jgi:hypothetical protein
MSQNSLSDYYLIELFLIYRGTEKSGSTVAPILNQMTTKEMPPTFFRTNKYTNAFQVKNFVNLLEFYVTGFKF